MSAGPEIAPLLGLVVGQEIPFGGDRVVRVDADLAARFRTGGTEPDTRLGGGGAAGNGAGWRGGLSLWVGHADAARD